MPDLDTTVETFQLFADPTRLRLLALVDGAQLSVAELTRITGLPQSRVSTHLGRLRSAGLLLDRKRGASTLYTLNDAGMRDEYRAVWEVVAGRVDDRVLSSDLERRDAVVAAREQRWPDQVAGQMETHYSPGRTWEATARGLLGLLRLGDVLDVGSGDGAIARLLSARARSITCLDQSDRVIEAARGRLSTIPNVRLCVGDMHALPFDDGSFDQVLHFHALTYSDRPDQAIAEAHRVLRPGGDLVLVTLRSHDHADISAAYSQVNTGFTPDELRAQCEAAGLDVALCDITSRERKKPYFEVISVFASKRPSPSPALEAVASS